MTTLLPFSWWVRNKMAISQYMQEKLIGIVILIIGLIIDMAALFSLVTSTFSTTSLIFFGVLGLAGFFTTRHGIYVLGSSPCRVCGKPLPNDMDYCPHCMNSRFDLPRIGRYWQIFYANSLKFWGNCEGIGLACLLTFVAIQWTPYLIL